jgi:hypothetical protein
MTAHWLLFIILSVPGAGYVTTDKIEGFTSQAQCERSAALLYSTRSSATIVHVCMEVK